MKKVLIVTYYWPPAGGPGVQRVLKFVKYLPQFGWQPIVLTVKEGEYPAIDESLAADIPEDCPVYKTASLEPNQLYKRFVGMKSADRIPTAVITEQNPNWKKRLANWIRLNFFIPDAKILWKPIAVREGKKIIRREKPDLILSSSPPPTVHLIARKLSRWSGIKWIADFRDPWTDIYYYDRLKKNALVDRIEKNMEKTVLDSADRVVTVSPALSTLFADKMKSGKSVKIIPNGFDADDFDSIDRQESFPKFTIAYGGKLNDQQNPENLWRALQSIKNENPGFASDLQLLFMGNFSPLVLNQLQKYQLEENFNNLGYVNHQKVLTNLCKAHILLLVIPQTANNTGILTGKVFEYLNTGKYILGIGPDQGDVAEILNTTQTGKMFSFADNPANLIREKYRQWKTGMLQQDISKTIDRYSRKTLTAELVNLFEG